MRLFVFSAAFCALALGCAAAELATNSVPVSGHGTLQVVLPSDWMLAQTNAPEKPALIEIRAPSNRIAMQFTVYWDGFASRSNNPTEADFERIITNVVSIQYVPVSAEKKITLEKLKGPAVTGLFVRFTDARWFAQRKPPGEFNNVTTGMFRCGNLWGNFNLLTDDKDGPQFKEGMQVLKSFRRKPEK